MHCPVMYDEASEARKATTLATSSGSPYLLIGVLCITDFKNSLLSNNFSVKGVFIYHGAIELTLILCSAHSTARFFVSCIIPAFVTA